MNIKTKLEAKASMESLISIYADNEPIAVRILRSGWSKPQTYHVLMEFGDIGTTDYLGVFTSEQIKEKYGIEIDKEDFKLNEKAKKIGNDQELGGELRRITNKYRVNTEI
jgi:hypothetical protein